MVLKCSVYHHQKFFRSGYFTLSLVYRIFFFLLLDSIMKFLWISIPNKFIRFHHCHLHICFPFVDRCHFISMNNVMIQLGNVYSISFWVVISLSTSLSTCGLIWRSWIVSCHHQAAFVWIIRTSYLIHLFLKLRHLGLTSKFHCFSPFTGNSGTRS